MRPSTSIPHNSSNRSYAFGSAVKERTTSFTQKYLFGFNNQELEIELGEYYSFEYRVHDARLGRFLSVDPLAEDYPYYSSYQFAGNQVVWAIDLEGLEPYVVTHRSFAPWKAFGNFSTEDKPDHYGDDRGFSLCPGTQYSNYKNEVSSRVNQSAYVELLDDKSVHINTVQTFCSITRRVPSTDGTEMHGYGNPNTYVSEDKNNIALRFEASNPVAFGFDHSKLWVQPVPDIDWTLNFSLSSQKVGSVKYLHVEASVEGKGFPAYESFISDANGTKVFLFALASPTKDRLDEELIYPFNDKRSTVNIAIETNNNGEFTGNIRTYQIINITKGWLWWKKTEKLHIYDEKSYTIQEWNKMMGSKKAAPDLNIDEGTGGQQCIE